MSNPQTRPKSDRIVYMATAASVAISPGDALYEAGGTVRPASSLADLGSEAANQKQFAAMFFGFANGQKLSSDTSTSAIPVIVGSEVKVNLIAAATVAVGDLIGIDEATSGTALTDQTFVAVTTNDAAVGRVIEAGTSVTSAWIQPFDPVVERKNSLFGGVVAQTIAMNDAAVVLTKVPGTPAGTVLYGSWLLVDPEGNTEILTLPPEADCAGDLLLIKNTGGETITLNNDAAATIATIATSETCFAMCDGVTWTVMQHVFTT